MRGQIEEELETVPIICNNNNNNLDNDSNSNTNNQNDNENVFDEDINDKVDATTNTTINAKVVQAMKNLQASYNKMPTKSSSKLHKKKCHENLSMSIDLAMVANDTKPALEEPQTFNKALNYPNNDIHKEWQEAIHKEFVNMNKQQVW